MRALSETVKEFLVESYENLDRLDRTLVDLEQDPEDQARLADIFRTIHTLKATCGFLEFSRLESLSHAGENLLSHLRDGLFRPNPEITTGLLAMTDAIREILAAVEETGGEGDKDVAPLARSLADLDALHAAGAGGASGEVDSPTNIATDTPQQTTPAEPATEGARATDDRRHGVADRSLRVGVVLLDTLFNLVGELVLARNQIVQCVSDQSDSTFISVAQRLNLVTSALQDEVMKTRMQTLGSLCDRFPRVVRDLAAATGKRVRIEMEGHKTALDRVVIEAIKDPLTHLIRNAVDHGIEPPDVRAARGKDPEGTIRLRAVHDGRQTSIEISDDGGGIDAAQLRDTAVQKGLLTIDRASQLTDHELFQLIFIPGFSTATTATQVSGRGVGMDVVRTNIEMIGGTVDLRSTPAAGTTLTLTIPLTLAIIPALMVTSGGQRFAIPKVNVLEPLRLEGEQLRNGSERAGEAMCYRFRDRLLPLAHLNKELGLTTGTGEGADQVTIVVLKVGDRLFGLIVEAIGHTEDVVIRPLGAQLEGIRVFAGATIMGDGTVALILDVEGIARRSQVAAELKAPVVVQAVDLPSPQTEAA